MAYNLPSHWKQLFADHIRNLSIKGNEAFGLCCFHDDSLPSFYINRETSEWICHAGCGKGNYWTFKKMLENPSLVKPAIKSKDLPTPSKFDFTNVVATYIYKDKSGEPTHEVLRDKNKNFIQRKVGGHNMEGVERIPYNLDQLWKRKEELLFWVEGEKDADRLTSLGLLASTSSGGANNWRDYLTENIPNNYLVVIPDQDLSGQQYATAAIDSLTKKNKTVLQWDCMPSKDISDYLDTNSTMQTKDLKEKVWKEGNFYFSKENPFAYFEKNNIPIDPWRAMQGNRLKFLMKQCQTIYNLMDEFLEPHHGKIIDLLDNQGKETRDIQAYTVFCRYLHYLVLAKEFHAKIH